MEEAAYAEPELKRARGLARGGHIGGIAIAPGTAIAAVRDGDDLWSVRWSVPTLDRAELDLLVDLVGSEAGRIVALLGGDLPEALIEEAEDAGVELLPFGGELAAECSCTAWVDPCAHALAVAYQAGWLIDADPLVLTALRGLPRDELLSALHSHGSQPNRVDAQVEAFDPDLEAAIDAALRAGRVLELLEHGDGDVGALL